MTKKKFREKKAAPDADEIVLIIKRQTVAQTGGGDFREKAAALLVQSLRSRHRLTEAESLRRSFERRFGRLPSLAVELGAGMGKKLFD